MATLSLLVSIGRFAVLTVVCVPTWVPFLKSLLALVGLVSFTLVVFMIRTLQGVNSVCTLLSPLVPRAVISSWGLCSCST